jgi:hypothetical protein
VQLQTLLSASYWRQDDLVTPTPEDLCFLKQEFSLENWKISPIGCIMRRPGPPRPLHYQVVLGRNIVIVERMDLHLIWTGDRIFLQLLLQYLLDAHFGTGSLSCRLGGLCTEHDDGDTPYPIQKIHRCALGLLFSYAALISYESDFFLAQEKRLIPEGIRWGDWRNLVHELGTELVYDKVDRRFHYGELGLNRLKAAVPIPPAHFSARIPATLAPTWISVATT